MRSRSLFVGMGLMVLAVVIGGYLFWQGILLGNDRPPAPQVGKLANEFEALALDGSTIRLSDYRGKGIVLNFWATWCHPCEQEMPLLQESWENADDEYVVLAVNYSEGEKPVREFAEQYELTFPVLLDPKGDVFSAYVVNSLPTTFFINPEGTVTAVHFGELKPGDLARYLKDVL